MIYISIFFMARKKSTLTFKISFNKRSNIILDCCFLETHSKFLSFTIFR